MVKDGRIASMARGIALFISLFALLNLQARFRRRGFDANLWWIDFRPLPGVVGAMLVGLLGMALLSWAIFPFMSRWRRAATVALPMLAAAVAIWNAIQFWRLLGSGAIETSMPVPFSLWVALAMLFLLHQVTRKGGRLRGGSFVVSTVFCAIAFPLGQIAAYGLTDYRRPADAILVFGARAYADGQPSDALGDRVLTAIQLFQQGLAPTIIFSGGPGDGRMSEAQVMQKLAIASGVPAGAIILDDAGFTTDATVHNAAEIMQKLGRREVLAVSHAWHLPRIKLRCEREGLVAFTVPADERGQPLKSTPYLVLREVAGMWVYYLRAVLQG